MKYKYAEVIVNLFAVYLHCKVTKLYSLQQWERNTNM